jgi:hypothetical protein
MGVGLRGVVKRALFGPPGRRAFQLKHGLHRGLRFHINPADMSISLLGMYEREIAAVVAGFTAKAVCALDVGAHDGWYALYFASRPNIQRVFAFEPEALFCQQMRDNFALNSTNGAERNGLWNKVEVVPKLVGDHDDDQFCSIDRLIPDLPRPALLKIDVDGGEADVFRGAARTLTQDGCMVVLETHSLELEQECDQFLKKLGYRTQIIRPAWYRKRLLREGRRIAHNQWLVASR